MILQDLVALCVTVAAIYVILLGVYVTTCLVVARLNRHAAKIQPMRQTPLAQIRRDQGQSVLSLGVIATMLGSGHWAYVTLGWDFRPLPGIGGW